MCPRRIGDKLDPPAEQPAQHDRPEINPNDRERIADTSTLPEILELGRQPALGIVSSSSRRVSGRDGLASANDHQGLRQDPLIAVAMETESLPVE